MSEKEPCSVCAGHGLDVEKSAGCHSSKGLPAYAHFLSNSHPFLQGCVTQQGMAAAAVTWCGAHLSAGECPALRVRSEYLISSSLRGGARCLAPATPSPCYLSLPAAGGAGLSLWSAQAPVPEVLRQMDGLCSGRLPKAAAELFCELHPLSPTAQLLFWS